MKLIHISDLHLGKRVSGFSMLEDQEHILAKIQDIIAEEAPDAVLIAGDVYDKLLPPAEAVSLLDSFLSRLSELKIETFIISGNHDSAERIAFGASLMNRSGIHFSPVYNGKAASFTLSDEFGKVNIYLLPYLRTADVRRFFPDADITSTDSALRTAVDALGADFSQRNIIISHQFVTGGVTCDSERNSLGGTECVSADVYAGFDYAALGHLHGAQFMGGNNIRYSGTPLKYSFSEANHKKSVTVLTLGEKGSPPEIKIHELSPLRDMRILKGSFGDLIEDGSDDYLKVILTDASRVTDALIRLRTKYPHIMCLEYEREAERKEYVPDRNAVHEKSDPLDKFEAFFKDANGKALTDVQREYMKTVINTIWGE